MAHKDHKVIYILPPVLDEHQIILLHLFFVHGG